MIVKSMKDSENEILITQNENDTYSAIKIVNNKQSEFHSSLDLESAMDLFDIWTEELNK